MFFAEPLVRLIYERGAFTAQDTHLVAQVQRGLALQLPFYLASILVVRLISSLRANHILMFGAIISVTVNFTLNYALMRPFGVAGIALSTSAVYLVSFLFVSYNWRRLLQIYQ